jgi:hypothetical protein
MRSDEIAPGLSVRISDHRDRPLEIKRLQTSARMINTFQQGVLALHRLRTGGTQRVVVQYVHRESGAQAVVGVRTGMVSGKAQ